MLDLARLSDRIADVASGRLGFGAFEDWFRNESKNIHLWGDDQLKSAVFAVEDVFSQYHFEALRGDLLNRELENAILPFAPRAELASVGVYVGQQMTVGEHMILSGNNSVPIFRKQPGRYIRAFDVMAEGRSHSAYTYAPMAKAYGFGHPLQDPDLATEVLPLHAEPA